MHSAVSISLNELMEVGLKSKHISFLPNQKTKSILSGRHSSKLRGRGMDFLELKNYVQGDNVRNIDWKASMRSQKTYVRVFSEEKDRSVYIVLSQQSNMFFGSRGSFKSVQAAKLASVALHAVMKNGDRVGAVLYDDEEILQFKAAKGKKSAMHFLQELSRLNSNLTQRSQKPNSKMLNRAMDFLMTQVKHDDLIILIGDGSGLDDDSRHKITLLSQHNDIIGAIVYDDMERKLPDEGSLLFQNFNEFINVNSSDKSFQDNYSALSVEKVNKYKNLSLLHKIPLLEINTNEDVILQLQRQLGTLRATR